jgi:hypothetical protein
MDVIALQKSMRAKKAMKALQERLGDGVQDKYPNVKTRLEELEKKDPHVTLYNRVSDVEATTAANLNKHNLRMNAVVSKNRYGMTDLAFDDFGDDTGIDKAKSVGFEFDSVGKKVKMNTGAAQAEVVTTAEITNVDPSMIVVAQTSSVKDKDTKAIDLASAGIHVNTEVVSGKVQLTVTSSPGATKTTYSPTGTYESPVLDLGENFKSFTKLDQIVSTPNVSNAINCIPAMTGNTTPSGEASAMDYWSGCDPWKAFDQKNDPTSYWHQTAGTNRDAWLAYEFPTPKVIVKYSMAPFSSSGYAPKTWTFEGWNGSSWIVLDSQSDVTGWNAYQKKEFTFQNKNAYKKYRLNMKANGSYIALSEVEMFEALSSSDIKLYTSTSTDGVNFSSYAPLNTDGTIASPQGRYIKIKAEMIAGGELQVKILYDFVSSDASQFQTDAQLTFDGSLKLRTSYTSAMTKDAAFLEEGTLLRQAIYKSSFKTIEKLGVTQ